jgi:hypothetical protein
MTWTVASGGRDQKPILAYIRVPARKSGDQNGVCFALLPTPPGRQELDFQTSPNPNPNQADDECARAFRV